MKRLVFLKIQALLAVMLMCNAALAVTAQPGPVPVSEPGTFALLAGAVAVLAFFRRKK